MWGKKNNNSDNIVRAKLTRDEAAVILNEAYRNKIFVSQKERLLCVKIRTDRDEPNGPEFTVIEKLLLPFWKTDRASVDIFSDAPDNSQMYAIPLDQLDMSEFTKLVHFPGSERAR